ncbi:MAG: FKBP-type peptidyl-prolyl cis-trans isomerase [Phenylobacterium sp.]|nr:MAG: FKBP-type peptidyl-prolyl cis-trans isomerase [Phenylobacterium sp.]
MRKSLIVVAAAALALAACHPKPTASAAAVPAAAQDSKPTADGQAFLDKTAKKPGVHVLPDGLQYEVVSSGPASGQRPQKGDEIKVNYEGRLIDGKVFDSSYERGQPAAMPLEHLVPGWEEALPLMRPGDVWMLYLPPKLGYGAQGAGGGAIPPNAVLVFKIELIDFLPAPGRIQQG